MDKKELQRLIKESLGEINSTQEFFKKNKNWFDLKGGTGAIFDELEFEHNGELLYPIVEVQFWTDSDDNSNKSMARVDQSTIHNAEEFSIEQLNAIDAYLSSDEYENDEINFQDKVMEIARETHEEDLDDRAEAQNRFEGLDEDDELSMSDIDMPIQDKGVFTAMDNDEVEDDMSDLAKYRKSKGGDYEGGYQDDISVSPGYFNEEELAEMIREGVEKLHRKSLIENRLEQINDELNALNNPEAWENARTEAKSQLAKKNVAWQEITTRENLMSESKPERAQQKREENPSDDDNKHWDKTKKMPWQPKKRPQQKKEENPTNESDESNDLPPETETKSKSGRTKTWEGQDIDGDLLSEISFRDVESMIPIETPKDTATIEAESDWKQRQQESVSEIMGRAADLMAEAKKKYNNISK